MSWILLSPKFFLLHNAVIKQGEFDADHTWGLLFTDVSCCRTYLFNKWLTGLEIATDTVANATNISSLATKNSGLVATLVTRYFSMS